MRLKMKFLCVFGLIGSINSQINFNQECQDAVRAIGLPKIWKTDLDAFPLTSLTHQHTVVNMGGDQAGVFRASSCGLLSCLNDDSPQLINTLRERYIKDPSKEEYNLTKTKEEYLSDMNNFDLKAREVDKKIFKGRIKDGFFVEAGGKDFEEGSLSLYYEMVHGWKGLLVEPYSTWFDRGILKKRKAYSVNAALSTKNHPSIIPYNIEMEGLVDPDNKIDQGVPHQCIPLYSLLLALGSPTVNYFSLDIEGSEFQVLMTIPWKKVDIQVMTIETHFVGERSEGTLEELIEYLEHQGYIHLPGFHQYENDYRDIKTWEIKPHQDDLFIRKDIYDKYYLN